MQRVAEHWASSQEGREGGGQIPQILREPYSHFILELNVKGSEKQQNAGGWARQDPHRSESFKLAVWFSVTSVIHWMWPQRTMRLHRSEGGGRISVQYQNALTEPIKMELSEKKKKNTQFQGRYYCKWLPSFHIFFFAFDSSKLFSPEDTGFFDPSSTGHGPGKL